MAGKNAIVWVLITDGATARICSTGDAGTIPVLAPDFSTPDWDERAYRAWFRADCRRLFSSGRRQLALHLAQLLHEAASEGAFNGLVVIASPQIRDELQRALSMETRALLIGNVISDLPSFSETDTGFGAELHH
jgi:protein required for attachment to host cells